MHYNILCIEDHPDNMTLMRRIIRSSNYTLIEAKTGMQGLSIISSQRIDLILLDINLPDIDGYEIARRLRSSPNPDLARIPIIAVTANALKGDAVKVLDAGCNVYVAKPFDIQMLVEKIREFTPAVV